MAATTSKVVWAPRAGTGVEAAVGCGESGKRVAVGWTCGVIVAAGVESSSADVQAESRIRRMSTNPIRVLIM